MARILLAGYLGSGNLGDDAMMLGFTHGLQDQDVTVMTGNPEETNRLYGFDVVARKDSKAVDAAIKQCDALVFPGGSIFQDVTSVFSVKYYADLVSDAKKAGKKVFLLGQGVGPLNSFFGKRMAASAFGAADAISVRDPQSMQALKDIGVQKNVRLTADSAFLLPQPHQGDDEQSFSVGNMKSIGIAPRPLDKKTDVSGLFAELCKLMYQSGTMPVLIEMDSQEDGPLIEEIHKKGGGRIPQIRKLGTPMNYQMRVRRMEALIAMRLHAGVLGATVGIPALMVSYDPKVTAFAKMMEMSPALPMEGLTATRLFDAFTSFMKDRERNGKILERKRAEMIKLAQGNLEIVREQLRSASS
ncbi:MAG: polysaccharide pyruvyl transferase CsaB [Fimbriimonas sp.]